ncbi:MAG: ParA family protein [Rhodobacteraceae bacterium]|nr:ParA family protein [Paracoccaceae bacterium]
MEQVLDFVAGVLERATFEAAYQYLSFAVAGALLLSAGWLWGQALRIMSYFRRLGAARAAVARVRTASGWKEGEGMWRAEPVIQPARYDEFPLQAMKVLNLANLKGGVGKTTLAANIGAALALERGKRVLLLDLDFQGTLTRMCLTQNEWLPSEDGDSPASWLVGGHMDGAQLREFTTPVNVGVGVGGRRSRFKVLPAYYDLATTENRVLVEWLTGDRRKDPRYTLAEILYSPAVQREFDVVIIDSPPRLSSGGVQALCAASHLLIPTILDRASTESVSTFVGQVSKLKTSGICPHIDMIGVVGTMSGAATSAEDDEREFLKDALHSKGIHLLSKEMEMPRRAAFPYALPRGIAFWAMGEAQSVQEPKNAIRALARYVDERMFNAGGQVQRLAPDGRPNERMLRRRRGRPRVA